MVLSTVAAQVETMQRNFIFFSKSGQLPVTLRNKLNQANGNKLRGTWWFLRIAKRSSEKKKKVPTHEPG
jgi:hypothetical protein